MSLYDKDRGAEIRRNLSAAQRPIFNLARLLQRIAFAHDQEQAAAREMAKNPDGFDPAPLYVRQATVLFAEPALRRRLREMLP